MLSAWSVGGASGNVRHTFSRARTHGGRTCRTMYFTLEYLVCSSGAVRGLGGVKVIKFAYAVTSNNGILSRTGSAKAIAIGGR